MMLKIVRTSHRFHRKKLIKIGLFYLNRPLVKDRSAPQAARYKNDFSVPGVLLLREVFDPVINEVMIYDYQIHINF